MANILYKGFYFHSSDRIVAFRSRFKQIGRNIFVITEPAQVTLKSLQQDRRSANALIGDQAMTVGMFVRDALRGQSTKNVYRKATEAEIKEYEKARAALDKCVEEKQAKIKARLARERKKRVTHAISILRANAILADLHKVEILHADLRDQFFTNQVVVKAA